MQLADLVVPRLRVPSGERVVWGATAAIVVFLVAAPLLMLLFSSIRSTETSLPFEATSFTLANYIRVFSSSLTYRLLWTSAWFAGGTVLIALGLTIAFSFLLERTNIPLRSLWVVLVLLPMAFPGIVQSMAWILLANPTNGLLNGVLRSFLGDAGQGPLDIYSLPGMILVSVFRVVPSMYIMLSGTFARLDPALEDASDLAGARPWTTIHRITLPLLRPGILAAAIYYLIFMLEVFEIPALLGMSRGIFVFSTLIYDATHPSAGLPNYGLGSGYAMIFLLLATGLIYAYTRATRYRERFAVVSGRAYSPRLMDLGGWRYVALAGLSIYFVLAVLLPFLVLVWASLLPSYRLPSVEALGRVSLDNYLGAIHIPGLLDSVKNTLVIAGVTAGACMTLSAMISWLGLHAPFRGAAIPDRLTFLQLGVPTVVLGLALIFLYVWLPLPIYGTIWIIVIGLTTRFLSYGTRTMGPAFAQIHRELEEASEVSGAPWWRTLGWVTFPLVLPSFLRGLLWVFVHGLTETTMALMLFAFGNVTLAVRMWVLWTQDSNFSGTSALAVLLILPSAVLALAVAKWTKPTGAQ